MQLIPLTGWPSRLVIVALSIVVAGGIVGVIVGVDVAVGVGVEVGVDVAMGVGVAKRFEIAPHPTNPGKSNNESKKMLILRNIFFYFILVSFLGLPPNDKVLSKRNACLRRMLLSLLVHLMPDWAY